MRGRHWTEVVVSTLLLLSEVVIAQLCKSPITLLDGFHTLYMLLNIFSVTMFTNLYSLELSEAPTHPPMSPQRVNFKAMRAQSVGAFMSNLVLLSLNVIYLTEICSFMLEPASVQRPLLLVATGAVSLVLKLFLLGLQCGHKRRGRTDVGTQSHIEVNSNALSTEERAHTEQGAVFNNNEPNGLNQGVSQNNMALTIRNTNNPSPHELHTHDTHEQHSNRQAPATALSPQSQDKATPRPNSLQSQWPNIGETLITPFLVLVTGLVTLSPTCQQHYKLCHSLVYLDPMLSLLAAFLLIAKAIPPVFRYGRLLLQGAPTHFSMDDLGKKIMVIPGVEAVHELHVWKLTETFLVASVHVNCDPSLQNRCVDIMLGVTKVLQNEGVSSCTVQPEFTASEPSPQLCGLACAEACAASMCCSHLANQHKTITSGRTKEEPSAGPEHVTAVDSLLAKNTSDIAL